MPVSETSAPLEAALDELYGVDGSEFVAVRKRLAGELRGSGDTAAAKTLLAARRPTTAAWALNQLVRREPALVEEFLERSQDLEAAQMGELEGGRDAIREATRDHRAALGAVTEAALSALDERGTDAYRSQIQATLQAASAEPSVAEQLRRGRFVKELSGATGFSGFGGLSLVPDLAPSAERARTEAKPSSKAATKSAPRAKPDRAASEAAARAAEAERRRAERERAAAEEAAHRLEEAEHEAQAAQDEADIAEAAAAEIHQRIDELERDLDAARRNARAADERVARTGREAVRLARLATKLRSKAPRA
jgi:DNA repair exonuclease SbcCD ATPase subunit